MTIGPESYQRHCRRWKMRSSLICLAALLLVGGCKSSRQPPEGTPIIRETRVWMLGDPSSAKFVAVVSPWTYWFDYFYFGGFGGRDRIMLEQTAYVFLCDASTGSVRRLCEIQVPDSVDGFIIKDGGVRFVVVGWDDEAAYVELRAIAKAGASYPDVRPFSWYRIARDGTCTAQSERPTGLIDFYDIPDYPEAGYEITFPFPAAAPYYLAKKGDSIRLSYAGVWIVEFSIDPVTYDLRPVDLGPDARRYLLEAMEGAKKRMATVAQDH
ncbi:MAG: hypothetical protein IPF82_15960 [Blastocatellia bacterium]|nr:hypothetical protein [Blastocatellia bacterium]